MEIQIGLGEAILDLLTLGPLFLLGAVLLGVTLFIVLHRHGDLPKVKTTVSSLLLYYYLSIIFYNIVGLPTLREFFRLSSLGESFFHPNVSLIPFNDGFSLSFILNIFCFIPLGFLCPLISRTYERLRGVALLALGISLTIELSQMFTLYRATDIDDLITNVLGAVIGYFCLRLAVKLKIFKSCPGSGTATKSQGTWVLPVVTAVIAVGGTFFS